MTAATVVIFLKKTKGKPYKTDKAFAMEYKGSGSSKERSGGKNAAKQCQAVRPSTLDLETKRERVKFQFFPKRSVIFKLFSCLIVTFLRSARLSMAAAAAPAAQLTKMESLALSPYVRVEKLKISSEKATFKVSAADRGRGIKEKITEI